MKNYSKLTKEEVILSMKNTLQSNNQSVYDHCLSVKNYVKDLLNYLFIQDKSLEYTWQKPNWLDCYKNDITKNLLDVNIILEYVLWHDLSKPYCLEIDSEGKRHFKDHEKVSYDIWMQIDGREDIGRLILSDMDIHRLRKENIEEFIKRKECITLLIVGLAEIHSNAEMFGGFNSDSFKIKWKRINKLGKIICQSLFDL